MHPRTPHRNPHDAPWLLPRPWTRTLQVTPGTTDSWDVVDGEDKGLGHRSNFVPTCLGCGWRPRSAQMTVLTPGEYWANPAGYGKCTRCFAKGDLPPVVVREPPWLRQTQWGKPAKGGKDRGRKGTRPR